MLASELAIAAVEVAPWVDQARTGHANVSHATIAFLTLSLLSTLGSFVINLVGLKRVLQWTSRTAPVNNLPAQVDVLERHGLDKEHCSSAADLDTSVRSPLVVAKSLDTHAAAWQREAAVRVAGAAQTFASVPSYVAALPGLIKQATLRGGRRSRIAADVNGCSKSSTAEESMRL